MNTNNLPTHTSLSFDDSANRFNALADFGPMMIWMSGIDNLCEWFNQSWLVFTGRSIEQELGNGWTQGIHAEDLNGFLNEYIKNFDMRKSFSMDYRLRRRDGDYRWIMHYGAPMYTANGLFSGFIGNSIDIHDRKLQELSLIEHSDHLIAQNKQIWQDFEAQKQLYETVLSATPDFVYTFSFDAPSHRFAYANAGLLKMFGKTYAETSGKTFLEIGYEPWHADMHNREIDIVRQTKALIRGEVPFNGTFGKRIYEYIFAPVFNDDGEVVSVAGITRDVTDRHNADEILRESEEKLLTANRLKDEFLAMLAHELRNPLAPISAATRIMTASDYDEKRVRQSCEIIERQVKHMVGLVDDLLDVSRITRGLVDIEKTPQNINTVISNAVEQVKPLLESKNHQLTLHLESRPAFVIGDHKRLVQIFANILNNAARYTKDNGEICLEMQMTEHQLLVTISDNGIGISAEDQLNIFDLFVQTSRSSDRSQGGLGIGLALVKRILALHDGDIVCSSSSLGVGSQFKITLPLWKEYQSAELKDESKKIEQQKSLSILVVDDNTDAMETMSSLLELLGHQATAVNDSSKALRILNTYSPDICILDIGLPKIDGYELARLIRLIPHMKHKMLIAVTGYGQESDVNMALKSGFDHHLVKPVDIDILIDTIEQYEKKLT